jgi:hypothetical protein
VGLPHGDRPLPGLRCRGKPLTRPGNGAMAANGEPGIASRAQEWSIQMSYETASALPEDMPGMPAETRSPVDFGRLRPGELIAGIASFLVLISLFFPWYSFAASAAQASATATPAQQQLMLAVCSGQPAVCSSAAPPQFSVSALSGVAGGWRFLILVVAIIAVLYVLSRTLEPAARAVRSHWQVLAGLTAFQGLLVLIAFFANPLGVLDSLGSASWAAGAFLALIAAIAAAVGAVLVMQEDKDQHPVSPAPADPAGS